MKCVLLSGGVDSSTALALALSRDSQVVAVSIAYNQQHAQAELAAAKAVAQHYGVDHRILDLASIFAGSHSALNAANNLVASQGDYADQEAPNTEVEFRNGVFIAILTSLAMQLGADALYFGAHLDDSGVIYPDCSPDFVAAMDQAVRLGTGGKVYLETPFGQMTKADIVKLGLELGVPYHLTYSCYAGSQPPCGQCGTCIDRRKAFEANGVFETYDQ